jgi:hypothetical protein
VILKGVPCLILESTINNSKTCIRPLNFRLSICLLLILPLHTVGQGEFTSGCLDVLFIGVGYGVSKGVELEDGYKSPALQAGNSLLKRP